jgi:hypothetical protein
LRYYRTTGLMVTQMQELVRRVNGGLDKPWNKRVGRPKSLGLYKAVEATCMYLRQNAAQEFIGDARDTSQPTISRYLAVLVPLVKSVLEEFVPSAADAIEVVKGRVVLVDGTLTPCWSYEEHQELWDPAAGFARYEQQMRSYVEANQEIGRMHVQMLAAPDPDAEPRLEPDMEALTALIERAVNGPELPDYEGGPDSGTITGPPTTPPAHS